MNNWKLNENYLFTLTTLQRYHHGYLTHTKCSCLFSSVIAQKIFAKEHREIFRGIDDKLALCVNHYHLRHHFRMENMRNDHSAFAIGKIRKEVLIEQLSIAFRYLARL